MTKQTTSVWLKFTLLTDTTFGRGDGVAGLVDAEVQHDQYGLPYLNGKTLRGLLGAECAEILFALRQSQAPHLDLWEEAAKFLFGEPGSYLDTIAQMQVGDACLPDDLRAMIMEDFRLQDEAEWGQQRTANLNSLTALRRQTAMDAKTGAPKRNMLRTMRVILRGTPFIARLDFNQSPNNYAKWLLAAAVMAFHRAGTGRNRGRGRLTAELFDQPFYDRLTQQPLTPTLVTLGWFNQFAQEVQGESPDFSHPVN